MQLNPSAFNRFLTGIGQHLSWMRSNACPCVSPHSGSADPDCPDCLGKGRIWRAAVNGYAGVSSMHAKRQYAQFGVFEAGDLLLTLPSDTPLYEMGQYDLVLLLDSAQPFSSILTRGENDLIMFPPSRIDRVFWREGGQIVESIVREVAGRMLDWGDNQQPPAGTQYSVTGRWIPDYFVYQELPTDRAHHNGSPLPRRVVVRRFDLYGR